MKVEKGGLPDPHGPLATGPSSSIASEEFKLLGIESLTSLPDRKKGGSYAKYTPEQKAMIAKRAAEHGVVASYHPFYLKESIKIVLRADPLPTCADSIAIHKNITANIIVFNDSRNYYSNTQIYAIRYFSHRTYSVSGWFDLQDHHFLNPTNSHL